MVEKKYGIWRSYSKYMRQGMPKSNRESFIKILFLLDVVIIVYVKRIYFAKPSILIHSGEGSSCRKGNEQKGYESHSILEK